MKRIFLSTILLAVSIAVSACGTTTTKLTGQLVITSIEPDTSTPGTFDVDVKNIGSGDAWLVDPTTFTGYDASGNKVDAYSGAEFGGEPGIDYQCDSAGQNCKSIIDAGSQATLWIFLDTAKTKRIGSDLVWFNVEVGKHDAAYMAESKEAHTVPYVRH